MARNTMEDWLIEEQGSEVIKRLAQVSASESAFRAIPMSGTTKSEPRMADMDVAVIAKGTSYGEDTGANDEVILTARKFGRALRLAEEDINDEAADIIEAKKVGWVTSFGIMLDNATMGTTAAANGGTVPFTSIYRALGQTNSDTGYTGGANVIDTEGALTYADLSDLASLVEQGQYFDGSRAAFIAHPKVKGIIRGIVDGQGKPIFTASPRQGDPDTVFGYPILFSNGAVTSATASATQAVAGTPGVAGTAGNALIVFANPDYLLLGKRSGPESFLIPGNTGLAALTDETILKVRARRGFAVAHEKAMAVLEIAAAA